MQQNRIDRITRLREYARLLALVELSLLLEDTPDQKELQLVNLIREDLHKIKEFDFIKDVK